MNVEMHGKEIQHFEFTRADGNPYHYNLSQKGITRIYLSATYHGDHDELWVVVENGQTEVARFSCRSADMHCIIWKDQPERVCQW